MSSRIVGLVSLIGLFLTVAVTAQEQHLRIASYNIKFLDENEPADRFTAIKKVIAKLNANVIALQEIDDRAALEKVFNPNQWTLVIDDDSGNNQDLALAVKKPLEITGLGPNLDADNDDFLFSNASNTFFPNRRDVLHVQVKIAGVEVPLHVFVVHAKSRFGGRAATNFRRVGAAQLLLAKLEQDFEDVPFVLLGDFNDNYDDQSLNILETGNPNASADMENAPGQFLINLTEPLSLSGQVTHDAEDFPVVNGSIENIDVHSRQRNFDNLNTNVHTGDILFDQILIPAWMIGHYVADSAKVLTDEPAAKEASDHLPVYADFRLTGAIDEPTAAGVHIVSLLPNPAGRDRGNEIVTLANSGIEPVSLQGWSLVDRATNQKGLSGMIGPGDQLPIELGEGELPLNNSGDEISLLDDSGQQVHRVSYTASQAGSGQIITFAVNDNDNE